TATRRGQHVRRALVAAQIAVALVVLAGAGLLARSLARLQGLDLGFATEHVAVLWVTFPPRLVNAPRGIPDVVERVVERVRALPSVAGASPVIVSPFLGTNIFNGKFDVAGRPELVGDASPFVSLDGVGP